MWSIDAHGQVKRFGFEIYTGIDLLVALVIADPCWTLLGVQIVLRILLCSNLQLRSTSLYSAHYELFFGVFNVLIDPFFVEFRARGVLGGSYRRPPQNPRITTTVFKQKK